MTQKNSAPQGAQETTKTDLNNTASEAAALNEIVVRRTDGLLVVDIAVVGNDGVVGTELFMGDEEATNTAVVRNPGVAYRLGARILMEEFRQAGVMQRLLLRYTLALFAQIAQTVVCNEYH